MGLCKCPKKKVTNQFCFEHRVNVCEHCIISDNHRSCVVQSYLQWLKDSDYDASCKICVKNLDTSDCVRLVCYHVFHWKCLDERESNLPLNTAPSGHQCPTCKSSIFPPPNLVSPIADALRVRLGQVNWGRNELGLPLFSEEFTQKMAQQHHSVEKDTNSSINGTAFVHNASGHHRQNIATESPHSVVNMIESYSAVNEPMSSRRPLLQREPPIGASDRDDNKYKRKTPQEIFSRWSRRLYAPASIPPWRKTWFIVLAGFLIFCCMIYLMYIFGRRGTNNDPMLDMNNNPNLIHDDE